LLAPRTPELVARRRAFAQAHSWPRRASDLLALLDELQELSGSAGRGRGAVGR
jgi:hypothetical protein